MFIFSLLLLSLLHFASVISTPVKIESRASLPVIQLPYGSFRAASYSSTTDIYTFKNIPYAAPPVGDLRWAKPAPPLNKTGIQDGSYGHNCPQAMVKGLNLFGTGNQNPLGAAVNQVLNDLPVADFLDGDEDCLFLDVYVPAKVIKNPALKLPVVVFIFGGGFVLGSKDVYQPHLPFYDGSGMMGQSGNNIIFVSFNYRLGAFGWLSGTTMERDALPNTGLYDQRAVFQWVRSHISLFGGDPKQVTAMGESAGAGSIMHHLVAQGGKLDPLFRRGILLSPAFEPVWDRAGTSEDTFRNFAKLAGCEGKGLACLRSADPAKLAKANQDLMYMQTPGTFPVGPAPDGSLIRQLPSLELATGNFWKIESLVMSHCAQESILFVSGAIATNDQFSRFVGDIFPPYIRSLGITDRVTSFYPPVGTKGSHFQTQSERVEAFIRDSSMTCNVRYLNDALGDSRVYNMQFSVSPGWHASDLFAVFYNPKFSSNSWTQILGSLFLLPLGVLYAGISAALQSYLTSYIITGDPNKKRAVWNLPPAIAWGHPDSRGEQIAGVVDVGNWHYSTVRDTQNEKGACEFWKEFSAAVTVAGGYAPPGAVVEQSLLSVVNDTSARYRGGNRYLAG